MGVEMGVEIYGNENGTPHPPFLSVKWGYGHYKPIRGSKWNPLYLWPLDFNSSPNPRPRAILDYGLRFITTRVSTNCAPARGGIGALVDLKKSELGL